MSEVIGKGVIEVSADSSKMKAGIDDAKRSIKSLGEANKDASTKASQSIDRYISKLQQQSATIGKSARETEMYKLGLRGASDAQLKAADSALRLSESHKNATKIGEELRLGFIAIGVAASTGLVAAAAAFDHLAKKAGDFQDMAEKTGDTAQNIASLAVAAEVGGVSMENLVTSANKLTKNLAEVNDDSKAAGAAIKALGLNLEDLKNQAPTERFATIAKALDGFADSSQKSAVAQALMGKSGAESLPFLKELAGATGRQVILTEQQIQQADEYSDKQKRFRTEIGLHAQAIAADMLPALADLKQTVADLAKDQEHAATASDILKGAFGAAIVVFQTIAVVASEVGFVFLGVGREIGAIAAQLVALSHLDLKGFSAISDAVKEDGIRARAELDRFQAKIMGIGVTSAPGAQPNAPGGDAGGKPKPKLKFNGPVDPAIAKSQLDYDLAQIKKASEQTANAFSNAEKIMEARRAAVLIDERAYYAAKLGFITLNSQAQEAELQKEIERLQREKLTGKDKLENDKKIVEAKGKLAKVQADAVANVEVNSIQEAAAIKKIAQSYEDASQAAKAYLDTVNKQNAREIAGIGKGEKFRTNQEGLSRIEDKQTTARQGLEGDLRRNQITREQYDAYLAIVNDTYAKEVAAYEKRTATLDEMQSDWLNGATEALQNYYDQSKNIAKSVEELFTKAFQGMEDALVSFVKTGKLDFASLADSIISDLIRMQIKASITGPLAESMKDGSFMSSIASFFTPNANGGVYSSPSLSAFSGGVYDKPQTFAFAKGAGVFGEAGPEAIMPLSRDSSGRLGVSGGGSNVVVNVIESPGNAGKQQQRSEGGMKIIDVFVEQIKSAIASDITRGSGAVPAALGQTYGLNRAAGSY
jgi:lambda family phage tail tape measure protein